MIVTHWERGRYCDCCDEPITVADFKDTGFCYAVEIGKKLYHPWCAYDLAFAIRDDIDDLEMQYNLSCSAGRLVHISKTKPIYELMPKYKRSAKDKPARTGLSPRTRFTILFRDNFHCIYCGRGTEDGVKLTVDHRNPVSKGGTDDHDNLVTACNECNGGKSNKFDTSLTATGAESNG